MSNYLRNTAIAATTALGLGAAVTSTDAQAACTAVGCDIARINADARNNDIDATVQRDPVRKHDEIINDGSAVRVTSENRDRTVVRGELRDNTVNSAIETGKLASRVELDNRSSIFTGVFDGVDYPNLFLDSNRDLSTASIGDIERADHHEILFNRASLVEGLFLNGVTANADVEVTNGRAVSVIDMDGNSRLNNGSEVTGTARSTAFTADTVDTFNLTVGTRDNTTRQTLKGEDANFRNDLDLMGGAFDRVASVADVEDVNINSTGLNNSASSTLRLDDSGLGVNHLGDPLVGFTATNFVALEDVTGDNTGLTGVSSTFNATLTSRNERGRGQILARDTQEGYGIEMSQFVDGIRVGLEGFNDVGITANASGLDLDGRIDTRGSAGSFQNQQNQGAKIRNSVTGINIRDRGVQP